MTIAKILENIVGNGVRYLKGLRFGSIDSKKAIMLSSFGDDFNVPSGYKSLFINTSNSSSPVCIGFVNKVILDSLNSGDKQVFSTNEAGDTIAAYIKFINDGTMHFNGDADNIAGFAELKIGFDKLRTDFNTFLTHVHGAAGTPPVPPATPSTANIDDCKKNNVKIE